MFLAPGTVLPGNLFKSFVVEAKTTEISGRGRAKTEYDASTATIIRAVLAEAKPAEIERWRQKQHPVTHTLVQKGKPGAQAGDKLILGDRVFDLKGLDDVGGLGLWTMYFAEELQDGN